MDAPVNCSPEELSQFLASLKDGLICQSSGPCTYSLGLEEEYSPTSSSGTNPSAPSRSMSIASRSYPRGKKTVAFHGFPSLLMSPNSTGAHGEALLMSSPADSHARTSAQPGEARELTATAQDCGGTWRELSVRYDRDTSSWRTHRSLWDEDLSACSLTLPKWGSMRDGVLLERTTPALPISANAAGSWPTPRANDAQKRGNFDVTNPRNGLPAAVKIWPTPTASLGAKGGRVTPRKARNGGTLTEAVSARKIWPTPTASTGGPEPAGKTGRKLVTVVHIDNIESGINGGQISPSWVEWLMHWPIGWTSLKPIEIGEFCRWMGTISEDWFSEEVDASGNLIPRVGTRIEAWASRLKAIGNGQVPQAASIAWQILSEATDG